jgi:hypothetical protein
MVRRGRRAGSAGWIAAAIGAAAIAACESPIMSVADPRGMPGDCPADQPTAGDPCGAAALCGYPGTDCVTSFSCTNGIWQSAGNDCPPPPPPGSCPMALPSAGAPCKTAGQMCLFDVAGQCPAVFVATCGAGTMQWSVADQSPPCPMHPCPAMEPMAGTACDYPYMCTYTTLPPGCPPQTENASCVNGMWKIVIPSPCGG